MSFRDKYGFVSLELGWFVLKLQKCKCIKDTVAAWGTLGVPGSS